MNARLDHAVSWVSDQAPRTAAEATMAGEMAESDVGAARDLLRTGEEQTIARLGAADVP